MAFDTDALLEEMTRLRDAVEAATGETAPGTTTEPAATSGGAQGENSTIKAIRAEAKRAEKRAAELEAENVELRSFKETTVKQTVADMKTELNKVIQASADESDGTVDGLFPAHVRVIFPLDGVLNAGSGQLTTLYNPTANAGRESNAVAEKRIIGMPKNFVAMLRGSRW